jgi:hypothetical protein
VNLRGAWLAAARYTRRRFAQTHRRAGGDMNFLDDAFGRAKRKVGEAVENVGRAIKR